MCLPKCLAWVFNYERLSHQNNLVRHRRAKVLCQKGNSPDCLIRCLIANKWRRILVKAMVQGVGLEAAIP